MTTAGRLLSGLPSAAPWRSSRLSRVLTPAVWQGALVLLVVLATAYYTVRVDRDFWYDEAMLVSAIRAEGWLAPWQPMSHFEQASPYGVYLVQKATLALFGFAPNLLRVPTLVAYAVGGLATWRAARIAYGGGAAAVAGVLALCSLVAVQESGDFKHYAYEFGVSGVLLWLGARSARSGLARRDTLVLFGAAILLIPFSNSVVIVLPAIAAAALLAARSGAGRAEVRRFLAGAVCFLLAFAVWYLVAVRPSTVYQIAYPTYRETSTVWGYGGIVQSVAQPSPPFAVPVAALAAVGLVVALIWQRALVPVFLPTVVAVALGLLGVLTGLVPFSADRHVLFLVPLIALAAGAAIRAAWTVLRTAVPPPTNGLRLITGGLVVVVALAGVVTIKPSAGALRQQAGSALAQFADRCPGFWVDWWTQPASMLYAEQLGIASRVHGTVSTASGVGQQAWAYRVMNDPKPYQGAMVRYLRAHPATCVVTGGRPDEQSLVLDPLANAGLPCVQFAVLAGIQLFECRPNGAA